MNPNDFDFLLSKGNAPGHLLPRNSILERFDPISGRKSVSPQVVKTDIYTVAANPSVSTIFEVDSIIESPSASDQPSIISLSDTPVKKANASIETRRICDKTVKLDSSEQIDLSNGGDGDHSLTSSTTETYETASIGEPLKVINIAIFMLTF